VVHESGLAAGGCGRAVSETPYDLQRDFVKFDPPRNASLSAYGLAQFVALAAADSHFLTLLPKQATALS